MRESVPALVALVIAEAFFVSAPYAQIAWSLADVAAGIWIASEVI